jgi:GNAT superfamily N-acetyltransferase
MLARIRPPDLVELARLQEIERAAGRMFIEVGLPEIAAHEPATIATLVGYVALGRASVIADDVPVGYVLVDLVDGLAHVEQLSVLPSYGRRGLGTALLEYVVEWAAALRLEAVTLTTFDHVPWNAPFYEKRGFRSLADEELGPELRSLRMSEAMHGLDPAVRVCMRRDL